MNFQYLVRKFSIIKTVKNVKNTKTLIKNVSCNIYLAVHASKTGLVPEKQISPQLQERNKNLKTNKKEKNISMDRNNERGNKVIQYICESNAILIIDYQNSLLLYKVMCRTWKYVSVSSYKINRVLQKS